MPTSARPTAFRVKCLRRRPFFLRRKKGRKERRQNQGFEILSAAEVLPVPVSFSYANQDKQISCLAFTWSLRLHLRRAPRLCWPILTGLFSASPVGRGAHTPPHGGCKSFFPQPASGSGTDAETILLTKRKGKFYVNVRQILTIPHKA